MDLTKLHGSIEKEKRWKPQSFPIERFDSPGEPNSRRVVDLVKFCPDQPSSHLQYGQTRNVWDGEMKLIVSHPNATCSFTEVSYLVSLSLHRIKDCTLIQSCKLCQTLLEWWIICHVWQISTMSLLATGEATPATLFAVAIGWHANRMLQSMIHSHLGLKLPIRNAISSCLSSTTTYTINGICAKMQVIVWNIVVIFL
jgi:hypothetical protein